jgi:hypothetical protein
MFFRSLTLPARRMNCKCATASVLRSSADVAGDSLCFGVPKQWHTQSGLGTRMNRCLFLAILLLPPFGANPATAKERVLDAKLHHLRAGTEREWRDFPQQAEGPSLVVRFKAEVNAGHWTLRLRQQDVRQTWKVQLNGKDLGRLQMNEDEMVIYLPVPAEALQTGENTLTVDQLGKVPDDIRVGAIALDDRPIEEVLAEATVDITVTEAGQPLPCRLTIVNGNGVLMTVGAVSGNQLAVRPGVIYTGTGRARFGLPAGEYTVFAGRGFAYGLDFIEIKLRPGEVLQKKMTIRREVSTPGWVSCDTHVHTLTFSGHGDCSLEERMVTLAGEGIELPIATDHNRHIDYQDAAVKLGLRPYFTPVVGNEVTTAFGHFNIFPVHRDDPIPDYKLTDWKALAEIIRLRTQAKAIIVNHGRDLHSGFRPFGPEYFLAVTGERLDGRELPVNAMEVVNSGAQQSDFMRLFHDWFGLLNRGSYLTPVGASDSHDVSRYIVGQSRTYIQCKDEDPGKIDVPAALASFLQGRVMVSCGLLTEITVNGKFGPGDLVPGAEQVQVAVRVLGPSWVEADRVELYANGRKIREARISAKDRKLGVLWAGQWVLPRFRHDVHLAAIASGPGVRGLYWPIAKPYQPTSPKVERRVIGATGAVWIDGDGDGQRTSAYGYAKRLVHALGAQPAKLLHALGEYDEAVAAQAASLLQERGITFQDPAIREAAREAGTQVERGFQSFADAWRESQIARGKR